ncbi:hypothetical protein [Microbulbifer epialgicus]|uniref:Uncharacterized protein n=1 Tax=Microbulbifer epialgicus TaxID=393907 RepID=A0ABV4NT89_9GAMM
MNPNPGTLTGEKETKVANHAPEALWKICDLSNMTMALKFVTSLNESLCAYSQTQEHVFGEYTIEPVKQDSVSLVVVPKPLSLERFSQVPKHAISPTGIRIYPGWYFDKRVPYLITVPVNNGKETVRSKPLLPGKAFSLSDKHPATEKNKRFLPVLLKSELREFNQREPYVHLHRLMVDKIEMLSSFDRGRLSALILERRSNLYHHESSLTQKG